MLRKLLFAAIFLTVFWVYFVRLPGLIHLDHPPEPGDGPDYDAIAFQIWKGRGFGYYWDDPEWRRPYEKRQGYEALLDRHSSFYSTTYRPPAMPLLLAGVYAVTDRNFAAWRILNCAIMAGAVTIAAVIAAELAGLWAALLTAAVALQSPQLTEYASLYMTEGLATLFVTLLAWRWVRVVRHGWTRARAAASGVVLGALMATRSIFVLWLPLVLLLPGADPSGTRRPWRAKAVCLLCALLVIGPWWIRNMVVTQAFMPLGSEGALNLPAGFGPRALSTEGIWASNHEDGAEHISARNLPPTWEVDVGKYRLALTLRWMRTHPREVLRLMYLHVSQEIRPRGGLFPDWLLPAAGVSALILSRTPGAAVLAFMIGANLFSIALTWSVRGRFMVPMQPIMIALVGAAIVTLAGHLVFVRRLFRRTVG